MNNQAPSIYESFNARTLTNEQLCSSFIVSEDFQELASTNHTIMIGPRGSGKTTLVRMLQVENLDIWNDPNAQSYRDSVSFSGVFIPTDRLWKNQYENIKKNHKGDSLLESLLLSTFSYHSIERLVSTLEYRLKRSTSKFKSINISKVDEAELIVELASLWKVKPKISSIRSLEVSITAKKKEIIDYISTRDKSPDRSDQPPSIIGGDIVSILGSSVRVINSFINERGHKWAFLFDELELAPDELIQPLVNAMRGGPEDLIFKLSLSPYHKKLTVTQDGDSSMNNQDLSFINLTSKSEKSGIDFSTRLCQSIFIKKDLDKPVEKYFEKPREINAYNLFKELSNKDENFKLYLNSNNIDIDDINTYTEKDKAPTIRKIKFIAYIRNYYIKKDGHRASRKQCPDYYAGFENLCKAMEYNPRMLIGLANKLIPHAKSSGTISISQQLSVLNEIFNSYRALLNTIALESSGQKFTSIYDVIDIIAQYFSNQIVGKKFVAEPKGTLTFKSEESRNFLDAIGLALNAGALIADGGVNESFHNLDDLMKARCRLSHIFSHKYNLLFAKSRVIEFSDVLKSTNNKVNEISVVNTNGDPEPGQIGLI